MTFPKAVRRVKLLDYPLFAELFRYKFLIVIKIPAGVFNKQQYGITLSP